MKNGRRKFKAIFLAMCMIVTAFIAVVSLPVSAQVDINTELRLEGTGIYTGYYVGGTGYGLNIYLLDIDTTGDITEAFVNLTTTDPDIIIQDDTGNWGDQPYDSAEPFDDYLWDEVPRVRNYFRFIFDVDNSCPIGDHTVNLVIDYINGQATRRTGITHPITLVIGSRATTTPQTTLFAGDDFKELAINVNPNVPNVDWDDVYLNLTRPTGDTDFTWQSATVNANTALGWRPGSGSLPFTGGLFRYRIRVADDKDPGIYTFPYTLDFTANGIRYFESGGELEIKVDFTPIIEASGTTTIRQGNDTVEFPITFTNNGNVDLSKVEVRISPITMGSGKFYEVAYDHYEGTLPALYYDWTPIGNLAMGASTDTMLSAALDQYLPAGEHKILLEWRGYYSDGGQTREDTKDVEVMGDWYSGSTPNPPYEERTREVLGPIIMAENQFRFNTHTGAFVIIVVTDDELSFEAYLSDMWGNPTYINARGDVTSEDIYVAIRNFEQVGFSDLMVVLDVGAGTPFFDPADHTATSLERELVGSSPSVSPGGTAIMRFVVDINAGWWQDNSVGPGVHLVNITVDATNVDTKERFTGTRIPVAMEITGFGPELLATMVSTTKITPGDNFTLTVTITNYGDDTAREVDAYLRADFVAGWSIVDQFVTSISSYGGNNWYGGGDVGDASWGWETDWSAYDQFNRSNSVSPGDVGVNNVPQIVELHDWIKRRETPPQGLVLWMHLDRLPAGASHNFKFEMISDVNMVEGMAYYETLDLYYVDSMNGRTYGPPGSGAFYTVEGQQVLIRSGEGEKYTGEEEADWSWLLYAIILIIIVIIIFIIGFALGGRGGGGRPPEAKPEEKPYEPFEEEYTPPAPPPAVEEEVGPPLPEEKPPE